MEELNIKGMYMELITEDDKIKFLQAIFKEINDISMYEIENGKGLLSERELKEKSEQITGDLRNTLKEIQTYIRIIYAKKQSIAYKEKMAELESKNKEYEEKIIELEKQYKEKLEKAAKEIDRRKEEVEKTEKKTRIKCKQDLKVVRANLIRTTNTAQGLGKEISKNEMNQEAMLRSINNILVGCEKAARCIKQMDFWPGEDEQFPEVEAFEIEEIIQSIEEESTSSTEHKEQEQEETTLQDNKQIETEEQNKDSEAEDNEGSLHLEQNDELESTQETLKVKEVKEVKEVNQNQEEKVEDPKIKAKSGKTKGNKKKD